jgi:integrase/recombinase XerD
MAIQLEAAAEALVQDYRRFQLVERRLSTTTVANAAYPLRRFLWWWERSGHGDLERLEVGDLHAFVLTEAARVSVGGVRATVVVLRGFLRYLYLSGKTSRDLSGAVPKVAGSRFGGLPRAVSAEVVAELLEATRRVGHRSGTGRSCCSCAASACGPTRWPACNWATSTGGPGRWSCGARPGVSIRCPCPKTSGPPWPTTCATHGRPPPRARCSSRSEVTRFPCRETPWCSCPATLRAAPECPSWVPIGSGTAATQMLRAGASLREVAQVLRHGDDTTTAIYAKVDTSALSGVVRAWPGEPR